MVKHALFAQRMQHAQPSFIREILKVTEDPRIISFAGGLPSPTSFPVRAFAEAAAEVLAEEGAAALQYRATEGYPPLRQYIAERYRAKRGWHVSPDEILITNGSQQALDLVGKILLDVGDPVVIERPGYLGAIQAFSLFAPRFHPVTLLDDGIDTAQLAMTLGATHAKLFYMVGSFQNPSGITYTAATRQAVADIVRHTHTLVMEDDPYADIRFSGEPQLPMRAYLPEQAIMAGSFSKTVAPGLRLGWVCAPPVVMEKLIVAKQASDLHTSTYTQMVLHRYLMANDVEAHIAAIRADYGRKRNLMVTMLERHAPEGVHFTRPDGGMFLWVTLPRGLSSLQLFELAIKENVAFVPGAPFYVDGAGDNTLRLNFSNSDDARIEEGILRLTRAMDTLLAHRGNDVVIM